MAILILTLGDLHCLVAEVLKWLCYISVMHNVSSAVSVALQLLQTMQNIKV